MTRLNEFEESESIRQNLNKATGGLPDRFSGIKPTITHSSSLRNPPTRYPSLKRTVDEINRVTNWCYSGDPIEGDIEQRPVPGSKFIDIPWSGTLFIIGEDNVSVDLIRRNIPPNRSPDTVRCFRHDRSPTNEEVVIETLEGVYARWHRP